MGLTDSDLRFILTSLQSVLIRCINQTEYSDLRLAFKSAAHLIEVALLVQEGTLAKKQLLAAHLYWAVKDGNFMVFVNNRRLGGEDGVVHNVPLVNRHTQTKLHPFVSSTLDTVLEKLESGNKIIFLDLASISATAIITLAEVSENRSLAKQIPLKKLLTVLTICLSFVQTHWNMFSDPREIQTDINQAIANFKVMINRPTIS